MVYSTFIGGEYDDAAAAVAVDGSGIAYVTGRTSSTDFPTAQALRPCLSTEYGGCDDAFVAAVSADGSQFVTPIWAAPIMIRARGSSPIARGSQRSSARHRRPMC